MSKVRLATIGNGTVGHRLIEDPLDKSDTANFDITVFCKELRIVCDRVHLLSYFSHHTIEELSLMYEGLYEKHGIKVLVGKRVVTINRQERVTHSSAERTVFYDKLIVATGSYPWIPPIKGPDTQDYSVYHTVKDLNAIESCAHHSKYGAVAGDGLLGLGTAGALENLGTETHVVEFAPTLVTGQFDQMSDKQPCRKIGSMGMRVRTNKNTLKVVQKGVEMRETTRFADGSELEVDFIVFSTDICPRDKLTTQCGLDVTPCGGIAINDFCQTSDPDIYAIDECVSWNNRVSGLVAPGYKMAQVAVDHILGSENVFEGTDLSAKLKLPSIDVGGIGDTYGRASNARSYVYFDESKGIYKRLIISEDNRTLLGMVLVDNISDYGNLPQLVPNTIELSGNPDSLTLPVHSNSGKPSVGVDKLPGSTQICSYFDVAKGDLITAINKGYHIVAALRVETKASIGCGGYTPLVTQVLNAELTKQGIEVNNNLCGHFAYSRQELFHLIRVEGIKTFEELLAKHGKGYGCEVCKPTVGSLLASCWNEYILKPERTPLQDSDNNFLTNTQKDDTYSVIPCSLGDEIAPEGLMAMGRIARKFNLYTRITDSQRLTTFGAQKDDLPEIWRQLTGADFETGHAYTEALRIAKVHVGNTWCHCGTGNNIGLDVELESRYEGIRTPYKMGFGVSDYTRECPEVQDKSVGIIAAKEGWNLYVCGSGGIKSRHADLLAAGIDCETLTKYLDRLMMFYIRTANELTRTVPRLENLEGGIDYLKAVVIDDKLGLNAHLEEEMACLRETIVYEWTETIDTPFAQTRLKHFINSDKRDSNVQMVPECKRHYPATSHECIPVTPVEDNT